MISAALPLCLPTQIHSVGDQHKLLTFYLLLFVSLELGVWEGHGHGHDWVLKIGRFTLVIWDRRNCSVLSGVPSYVVPNTHFDRLKVFWMVHFREREKSGPSKIALGTTWPCSLGTTIF